ncbi:MAG: DNA recombination protein RmuC [uncultured Sulfurovum sp.]|uniref:DNA recombination protein RmuC n=1 Tax=uncultured Sulfurovum sp. TaxID=269237 RepID=A0A6S6SFP4_9BACT|nr:MAG: DNA recombination protein RmuC [uncultured Sulfurovum sp.]
MDSLFTGVPSENSFYIGLGLFLLITILISTIIVVFMSRISKLEAILEQAKAVDNAKEERMSEFYEAFQEERSKNMGLEKELEYFSESKDKIKDYESRVEGLKDRMVYEGQEHMKSLHEKSSALEQLSVHYELLEQNFMKQEENEKILIKRNEDLVDLNNNLHLKVRETEIKVMEQQKQNTEKMRMLQEHRGEIKEEFAQLAAKVFEGNSKEFSKLSQENLSSLIKPMESQISEFKKQINTLYTDESKDRAMLKQEIMSLKELNQQISQDAINLTNALKGEKKQQGVWGEMILEKVLESSGLRKGVEYTREVPLRNDEGKNYRPDVLVHLPDNRDLIIDAKTSLLAYERYINTSNVAKKEIYLKEHIQAIRNHIRSLSEKNYDKLLGINTLDFIFMFVPIEGALATALEHDPSLYDNAFKKQILLVGPTTLLIGLRAIENVWKYEKQTQNAKEIANRAGALYDKFVSFSDDMVKLSRQFDTLQGSFESAKKRLSHGKGNIVRQVEQLKEMGAKTSKEIPKELS